MPSYFARAFFVSVMVLGKEIERGKAGRAELHALPRLPTQPFPNFKIIWTLQPSFNPRARIQEIPQRVPDKIERQHRQHHRNRREDHQVRRIK